jgi:hypothetical protein
MLNERVGGLKLFLLFTSPFLLHTAYRVFYPQLKPKIANMLSDTDDYIERNTSRFLKVYQTNQDNQLNTNMNQEFYSKEAYQAIIKNGDNPLEVYWKRRILFENTPRGNVIMFYDPYKLAFAYYCDTSSMPYKILNAIAMKYVLSFHCIHLFVDNEVTPTDKSSPIITALMVDAPDKSKKKNATTGIDMKNAPFVKFKKSDSRTSDKENDKTPIINYHHNKFVCVGKIINYSFLSHIKPVKSSVVGFHSNLLDNLAAENTLQSQVMSYKDFKNKSSI